MPGIPALRENTGAPHVPQKWRVTMFPLSAGLESCWLGP